MKEIKIKMTDFVVFVIPLLNYATKKFFLL